MYKRGAKAAKLAADPKAKQDNLLNKAMAAFGAIGVINAKRSE